MSTLQVREKEVDIQNTICQYLEYKGYLFWRSNNIPAFSRNNYGDVVMRKMPKWTPRGLPDITLIIKGIYYGLEVKRPKSYQTPEQKIMENQIIKNGGKYFVVRSLDDVYNIGL